MVKNPSANAGRRKRRGFSPWVGTIPWIALYAQRFAARNKKDICRFSEMGIWQMILPNRDNVWMKNYCEGIIRKLKEADAETGIFETVSCYVSNNCDTKRTAEEMSVHVNTVRYRIKKAQETMGLEDKDMEFQQPYSIRTII